METTVRTPRLAPAQVETFRREGYLIFTDPIFPEEKFQRLKAHFEEKLELLPNKGKTLDSYQPHDRGWMLVQLGIQKAVERRRATRGLGRGRIHPGRHVLRRRGGLLEGQRGLPAAGGDPG